MATYVLVHGAWGGSYGFRTVRRLLAAAGHEALAPSLTGLGERSHLTGDGDDMVPALPREFDDPAVGAWSNPRRHAQPLRTLAEPVRVGTPVEQRALGRTYIRATADPSGTLFDASAAHARTSPAWRYHEIATTHMVPENRPAELVELLLAPA
jgi:dienelactone hydrolase